MTTNPLELVARRTLDRALRGRGRYTPGLVNRTLAAAGRVVPQAVAASVIYRRWLGSQRRWLEVQR